MAPTDTKMGKILEEIAELVRKHLEIIERIKQDMELKVGCPWLKAEVVCLFKGASRMLGLGLQSGQLG